MGISPAAAVLFIFYIAFSLITLMNIVTSIVVEKVLSTGQTEQIKYMASLIGEAFTRADEDKSGAITLEEFSDQLDSYELQSYFRMIDIDALAVVTATATRGVQESGHCDRHPSPDPHPPSSSWHARGLVAVVSNTISHHQLAASLTNIHSSPASRRNAQS